MSSELKLRIYARRDQHTRWLLRLLVLLCFGLALEPMSSALITNTDDMTYYLASRSLDFSMPFDMAVATGRFFLSFSGFLYILPYLLDFTWLFKICAIGPLLVIPYAIEKVINKTGVPKGSSILFIIISIAFFQNHTGYYPATAFYLVFTLPIIMFCLSTLFFINSINGKLDSRNTFIYSLLFLLSILPYETFLILYSIIHASFAYSMNNEGSLGVRLHRFAYRYRFHLILIGFYAFLFVLFKALQPVDANFPSDHHLTHLTDFSSITQTWWVLTKSALPMFESFGETANFFMHEFWDKPYAPLGTVHFALVYASGLHGFIFGFFVFVIFLFAFLEAPSIAAEKNRKLFLIFLFILLLSPALHSITIKYQNWVSHGLTAYVPTFFSYIAICGLVFCLVHFINSKVAKDYTTARAIIGALISIVLSYIAVVHYSYNSFIGSYHQMQAYAYRLAKPALLEKAAREFPDGSVLYMSGLPKADYKIRNGEPVKDFWEELIRIETNKKVEIEYGKTLKNIACGIGNKSVYIRYESPPASNDAALIVGQELYDYDGLCVARKVDVISLPKLKRYSVIAKVAAPQPIELNGKDIPRESGMFIATANALPYVQGLMISRLRAEGISLDSVLISRFTGEQKMF